MNRGALYHRMAVLVMSGHPGSDGSGAAMRILACLAAVAADTATVVCHKIGSPAQAWDVHPHSGGVCASSTIPHVRKLQKRHEQPGGHSGAGVASGATV